MPKLFSYGTLQQEDVQIATSGRRRWPRASKRGSMSMRAASLRLRERKFRQA
ncbi:MAG TPA: hypothetical protein VGL12_08185 [Roseiarcus sp.]|jgi:hypothetical protein